MRCAAVLSEDGVPFFLYLAPYAAHKPCPPAPRHAGLFSGHRAPRTASFNEADVRDKPGAIRGRRLLAPEQIAKLDGLYRRRLECLQSVDEAIATLVATLESTGQLANTYIFFTSDNGFHLGQHRLTDGKYTAYDEDVHVPLLVRGPRVPQGATADAFVESVDLAPTIAQLAGTQLRVSPDGRSFVPLLRTPHQPPAGLSERARALGACRRGVCRALEATLP